MRTRNSGTQAARAAAVLVLMLVVFLSFVGCSNGDTPTKPVDTTTVVTPNVVTAVITSPADGSQVMPTFASAPQARVTVQATVTSSKHGALAATYTLDGSVSTQDMLVPSGTHTVCVTGSDTDGKSASACVTVNVPLVGIRGKIILAGTNSCPQGLRVSIGPAGEDSAVASSDCTYFVPTKWFFSDTAVVSVKDATGIMKDFFGQVPKRYYTAMNIVGVPTVWTIPTGTFAGTKVPIDLEAAYAPSDGTQSGFYARSHFNGIWEYMVGSIPGTIPTAFCRDQIQGAFVPSDSVNFWSQMATFHQYLGKTVYVPANSAGICEANSTSGVKLVAIGGVAFGEGGSYFTQDYTGGRYNASTIAGFNSGVTNMHELIHVLSFGHTCSWKTIMFTGCPASMTSNTPTAYDVAYIQLMSAVADGERVLKTRLSLAQAHQGERKAKGILPIEAVDIYEVK